MPWLLRVRVARTGNLLVDDHRHTRVAVVEPSTGRVLYLAPGASRAEVISYLRCSGWL